MKKIMSVIVAFILFLSVGIMEVNAEDYSAEYAQITSDGTILIEFMNLNSRDILLSEYISYYDTDNYVFRIMDCNDDYTVCTIRCDKFNDNYEDHEVTITYKEVFSDEFNSFAPNGKIVVTETALNDNLRLVDNIISEFNANSNIQFNYYDCDENYTSCTISSDDPSIHYEQHIVQIVYEEKFSDEFKKFISDGTLEISYYNNSIDKYILVSNYLNAKDMGYYTVQLNGCNNDYSICNVILDYSNGITEQHNIKMTYKEEYSETFKKIISDGVFKVTNSNLYNDKSSIISDEVVKYMNANNVQFSFGNCNEDYSVCDFMLYENNAVSEQHSLKVVYSDVYSETFKKLTSDGTIKIPSTSISSEKYSLISNYINSKKLESNILFNINMCNEDYSICTISYFDQNQNSEQHNVKIIYEEEYSETFKKLTSDGTLVVKSSTNGDKRNIIDVEVSKYSADNFSFHVSECNEDGTLCTVVLSQINSQTYENLETEKHNVKIIYKEEYSEVFKKLTSSNELVVKSIKPTTMEEGEFFLNAYASLFNYDNYFFYIGNCDEDYSVCDVTVQNEYRPIETHTVNITYFDVDQQVLAKVNSILAKLPEGKMFLIEDLEWVNFIVNSGIATGYNMDVENAVIDYSSEVKDYLGNMNARLDARAGWGEPFSSGAFGGFLVLYDDTIYGLLKDGGAEKKNVIYIPDDTEDTTEAYIAAAQKRINEYLKHDKVEISYGGELAELEEEAYIDLVDSSKRRDEYYVLTYENFMTCFLIVKDSSKIKNEVVYSKNDIMTGVGVSANSSSIPLDTTVKVNEITKEDKKYNELTTKLDVEKALIYDLKLYSYTASEYISKLDDGTFSVSIPLPDDMKNKELIAYYVNDDGKVEEYEVTVVDGVATFNTNHFSIYTIAEQREISGSVPGVPEVPNTYDGINNYIALAIISLVGIVGNLLYLKKKKLN